MYIYMYVCMYVCACVCVYLIYHIHISSHVCDCVRLYMYIIYISICVKKFVCALVFIRSESGRLRSLLVT